jgi:type IV secretory pathway VirD2 relaxase
LGFNDFPKAWHGLDMTVAVEAKAKELAVEKAAKALADELDGRTQLPSTVRCCWQV